MIKEIDFEEVYMFLHQMHDSRSNWVKTLQVDFPNHPVFQLLYTQWSGQVTSEVAKDTRQQTIVLTISGPAWG